MKMKFIAAAALAVWLIVTGWLATMVIAKPAVLRLGNDADETAAMSELRVSIERNRRVHDDIARLRTAGAVDHTAQLIALPLASPADAVDAPAAYGRDSAQALRHDVAMVLDTDGRRSAIVNGELVRPGMRLADGARVRSIGSGSVRIEYADGARADLQVRSPFERRAEVAR